MLKQTLNYITAPNTSLWFIGTMFFLPFIVMAHHIPISSFYGEWLAATLGVMAIPTLLSSQFLNVIKIPRVSFIFLALAIILSLQWSLGMLHSTKYALIIFSYFIWAFILVILGSHLKRELCWEKFTILLARFILLGGLVNTGIVILQIAMRNGITIPLLPNLESYGALGQENNFADYISLAIASLMYLYSKELISRKLFSVVFTLLIVTLSFSGSRSTLAYLGIFTILTTLLYFKAEKKQANFSQVKNLFHVGLWLLPIFIAVQLSLHYTVQVYLLNLPSDQLIQGLNSKTISLRSQIWHDCWRMATDSPWLGIGIGQVRWETYLLLDAPTAFSANRLFEHAHNLFLHLFTEMGITAPIIVLAGLLAWLNDFRLCELNLERWWLLSILAVIGFHSMLEYPLWYAYFLGITAVLLGAGEESFLVLQTNKLSRLVTRSIIIFTIVVSLIDLGILLIANKKVEFWFFHSLTETLTEKERKQYIDDLIWVNNYSLLAPYAELSLATQTNIDTKNTHAQFEIIESAMRLLPMRLTSHREVILLKTQGNHSEAVKALNRSLIAFPEENYEVMMNDIPLRYRKEFLDVLREARPESIMPDVGSKN